MSINSRHSYNPNSAAKWTHVLFCNSNSGQLIASFLSSGVLFSNIFLSWCASIVTREFCRNERILLAVSSIFAHIQKDSYYYKLAELARYDITSTSYMGTGTGVILDHVTCALCTTSPLSLMLTPDSTSGQEMLWAWLIIRRDSEFKFSNIHIPQK